MVFFLFGCEIIHWFYPFSQGKAGRKQKKVNFLFKQKINKNTWLKGNKWDYIFWTHNPCFIIINSIILGEKKGNIKDELST